MCISPHAVLYVRTNPEEPQLIGEPRPSAHHRHHRRRRARAPLDKLALALVAAEDGFTLQIVADRIITHDSAVEIVRSLVESLGCSVST